MYKLFFIKSFLCMTFLSFSFIHPMENADHNKQMLQPIVEHIKLIVHEKNDVGPNFVAIAGASAIGKSYFTKELAELLAQEGVKIHILKLDDFLNPDHFDSDHFHPHLEHNVAHSVIQKIKRGDKSVRKPAWNPKPFRPPSKIEEDFCVEDIDLILFEGEFTACSDIPYDFSKYAKFSIFIDAEDDDILTWNWNRKERTIAEKTKDEFVKNNKPCLQKYRAYVQSSKNAAAYVVLKDVSHRYALQK